MELGTLQEVDVRKVWAHEQYDFSKWLSNEKNIKILGDTLNLSLIDTETEKFVGSYRCDILCKDELTGDNVLIENQLEQTNHEHLGKIITYASGLDAAVVVWIVSSAKEEHASAINWLNKMTNDGVDFFLLEVHAYTIGNSMPAPMFKIIAKPNDFSKKAKSMSKSPDLNKSQTFRLEFWNKFNEFLENRGKPINIRKATSDHWYSVAIGSSQCHLEINLVNRDHRIRVELLIPDNKGLYDELYLHKNEIESKLSMNIKWDKLDSKKASTIFTYIDGLNFNNQSNYDELMDKTLKIVLEMRDVFKMFLK